MSRAAAFASTVVILDEPTAALGVRESRKVLDLLQQELGMPVKPGEFMDGIYRSCSFKPANGGTYYVAVTLFSIDKATFDKVNPSQFKRAAGTNLDAFFSTSSPLVSVWHAGNQLQIQVHFEDNAGQTGAEAAELKLATIAVTRF